MEFVPTEIPGVVIVEPDVYRDRRGIFLESYHVQKYRDGGIWLQFVQDNYSRSTGRTLRGLHTQVNRRQGKLIRVLEGEIFDVAADVRRGSASFGRWVGTTLSGDNLRQLYVPPGFLHGFCVTGESAGVEYKCTDFYYPIGEITVRWDDPDLAIAWPVTQPLLSEKDRAAPYLADVIDRLPVFEDRP